MHSFNKISNTSLQVELLSVYKSRRVRLENTIFKGFNNKSAQMDPKKWNSGRICCHYREKKLEQKFTRAQTRYSNLSERDHTEQISAK